MNLAIYSIIFYCLMSEYFVSFAIKFSPESLAEISILAKEGKNRLQSLTEKANVPQFGPCWKNAISDLQIGCKFLSENIQSDLALKFTDCFFQMSGHGPLKCNTEKSICLKKLSDREFNAYTEFYTHTQSICYFLQSQVWHEETEKTIDKLTSTSVEVSQKLEEAEKLQGQLLEQQKESLHLQNDLLDNSKTVATSLQSSHDKINTIMKDFQDSAEKQRELLINVFEHLLSFKAWVVDELSWFNSAVFYIGATILSFIFTSIARTRGARMFIFIIFTCNFLFERYLTSSSFTNIFFLSNLNSSTETLNSWIWLCRKFSSCLSFVILLYSAFNFYDYNFLNYKLLLEIKNQNSKILEHFVNQKSNQPQKSLIGAIPYNNFYLNEKTADEKILHHKYNNFSPRSSLGASVINNYSRVFDNVDSPNLIRTSEQHSDGTKFDDLTQAQEDHEIPDCSDNVSITSETRKYTDSSKKTYDLRNKRKTIYAF